MSEMQETIHITESMDTKSLTMSLLVGPQLANFAGVMHGGELLKILDQVAYACAARYSGQYAVTLSVDKVLFKSPIPVGSLLHFLARINYTGRTSMEVGIKVVAEDVQKRFSIQAASCLFTMVAKKDGKTCEVPQLIPQTKEEQRRFDEGKKRRDARLAQK